MSLINDALKRAQNDRNHQRANTMLGGGPAPRRQENGPFRMILIIVLAVGFAGWGVALLIMFTKKDPSTEVVAEPTKVEVVAQSVEPKPVEVEPVETEENKTDEVEAELIEQPAPVEKKTLKADPVVQQRQPDPVPVRAEPIEIVTEEVEKIPTPAIQFNEPVDEPEPNLDTIKAVLRLEISAVMGAGKKCRIIIAGRVVRVGELIDYDKDIRFMGKKGSTLYFKDSTNQIYEKRL